MCIHTYIYIYIYIYAHIWINIYIYMNIYRQIWSPGLGPRRKPFDGLLAAPALAEDRRSKIEDRPSSSSNFSIRAFQAYPPV